jgi:ribosome-binding factor A
MRAVWSDILNRLTKRKFEMPEQRARKYHQDRVAETLRDEIGAMIEGELSDPRISFAYISQVVLNPGGKSALIYVAVDGGPDEEAQTIEGLMAARGYIRHELLERMGVRHVPELSFHIDRSEKMKSRIDELLGRAQKRQKSVAE